MNQKLAIITYTNGKAERFVYFLVKFDDIKATFNLPNGEVRYIILRNCDRIDTEEISND